jgi:hypothetical protein
MGYLLLLRPKVSAHHGSRQNRGTCHNLLFRFRFCSDGAWVPKASRGT